MSRRLRTQAPSAVKTMLDRPAPRAPADRNFVAAAPASEHETRAHSSSTLRSSDLLKRLHIGGEGRFAKFMVSGSQESLRYGGHPGNRLSAGESGHAESCLAASRRRRWPATPNRANERCRAASESRQRLRSWEQGDGAPPKPARRRHCSARRCFTIQSEDLTVGCQGRLRANSAPANAVR